ncbi:hypothetical protein NFI96_024041 [Prochilodus magdalenae]|nr:hypothetical protein NFI96_024041 [Prochilodus magdalenae]
MVLIAATGLGVIHFHECPIQPPIPTYLIVIGACGVISLMLAYLKNTLQEGASSQLFTVCIFCILLFSICWMVAGTFWVYSIYPPNYDSAIVERYCQRTLYLFALWFNNFVFVCVFMVFTWCMSYLLYRCVTVAFCP